MNEATNVRIRNTTSIPQVLRGEVLPVGEWIYVPLPIALQMVNDGVAEVDPKTVCEDAVWKIGSKYAIYWLSPFSCGDGYATAAEAIVSGLLFNRFIDIDVKCCWFMVEMGLLSETLAAVKSPTKDFRKVGICLATPGEFVRLPTAYRIGWTMYESTDPLRAHPEWRHECANVDEVWVPTKAVESIFSEFVKPSKLTVVPLALSPIYRFGRLGWKSDNDGCFRISTWGGLSDRKSPLETLAIIKKVFPRSKYPDVRVTFKTRAGLFGRGESSIPNEADRRIRIVNETWIPSRMVELGNNTDLFVFPSKGEGYGLPPREAMLLGVPTIISNTTGLQELVTDNVWTVPIAKSEKTELGGSWDVPDWDIFADMLKWHYDNREAAKVKALRASDWLWSLRSPGAVSDLIVDRLSRLDPDEEMRKRELKKVAWRKLYSNVLPDSDVKMLYKHHEPYFDEVLRSSGRGASVLEIGVGSGATMYAYIIRGLHVVAIDNDDTAIGTAERLLDRYNMHPPIVKMDAFDLSKIKTKGDSYAVATSQGFFEHFDDADIRRLIREQLKVANCVVFSVPSVFYPTQHIGDERMMNIGQWRKVLDPFEITSMFAYGGAENNWHICVTIVSEQLQVRGTSVRYK